jgi:hypothetical protein
VGGACEGEGVKGVNEHLGSEVMLFADAVHSACFRDGNCLHIALAAEVNNERSELFWLLLVLS